MQIQISTRHGSLEPEQLEYIQAKAEKLRKYFGRIMSIEVAAAAIKQGWQVEIQVSAEHKNDFVAAEQGATPEVAMDQCVHKVEAQLRRYKEKVQNRRDTVPHGGTSPTLPDLPEPPMAD